MKLDLREEKKKKEQIEALLREDRRVERCNTRVVNQVNNFLIG